MNSLSNSMRVSASGLSAERTRMDVIATNIANANSIQTRSEGAFRRQLVVLEGGDDGVRVRRIAPDQSPLVRRHEPGNPEADADGFVWATNVKPVEEMVDMMSATRAYEANIAAFNAASDMARSALNIGKV